MINNLQGLEDSIREYSDYLEGIASSIVEDIRQEKNSADFMSNIIKFSENFIILQEGNLTFYKNSGMEILDLNNLNEILNEINLGLVNADYFLIADLFEYEIIPHLKLKF